jgi:DNA-binding response OmpR family regulator
MGAEYVIIDDDVKFAGQLKSFLEFNQLSSAVYSNAEEYLHSKTFDSTKPATYLVDLKLPGLTGSELVKVLRTKDKFSSIFILSGDDSEESLTKCFCAGADDYLMKPFNPEHLLLKIQNAKAKLDRFLGSSLTFGIKLVPEAQLISRNGTKIQLTRKEFAIASLLLEDQCRIYSRSDIISAFGQEDITDRTVDVHVCGLRKKLISLDLVIDTIRGKGYQIREK